MNLKTSMNKKYESFGVNKDISIVVISVNNNNSAGY